MRSHEITDNDAFVKSHPKPMTGRVETKLPCGATIKAQQYVKHPHIWRVVVFNVDGAEIADLSLEVTPANANAVYNFLRKIVHLTPGVEDKT